MPTESSFAKFEIPKEDIWGFIFEGKRDFPDDKGSRLQGFSLALSPDNFV